MVIRDADMYGCNWTSDNHSVADMMLKTELPCNGILVAGNRGASGIDGLLSTAIGFAVGCNKRVCIHFSPFDILKQLYILLLVECVHYGTIISSSFPVFLDLGCKNDIFLKDRKLGETFEFP